MDKYYKKEIYDFQRPIVDMVLNLPHDWAWGKESVDEFLMVCALEHFSKEYAVDLLYKVFFSLTPGGVFKFDVPDVLATVEMYREKDAEYMMRLIYGSGKNNFAFHRFGYTREMLETLVKKYPWQSIEFEQIVPHGYPMIGVKLVK